MAQRLEDKNVARVKNEQRAWVAEEQALRSNFKNRVERIRKRREGI